MKVRQRDLAFLTRRMACFCRFCAYHYPWREVAERVLTPTQVKHGGWNTHPAFRKAMRRVVEQHLKQCPRDRRGIFASYD